MNKDALGEKFNKQLFIVVGSAFALALLGYLILRITVFIDIKPEKETSSNADQKLLEQQKLQSASDQDKKNQLFTINSGIKSFFLAEKRAPDRLEELVPKYLAKVPENVGNKYTYETSADRQAWKLETVLSDGNVFEVEGP